MSSTKTEHFLETLRDEANTFQLGILSKDTQIGGTVMGTALTPIYAYRFILYSKHHLSYHRH